MKMATEIPVIDLNDFPGQCQQLRVACEDWGCFRVVNHKIPARLLSEMNSVVRSLFDQPLEIKRRNTDVILGSGYVAPTVENPLYEALGLYDINSSEAVQAFCTQLNANPQQRETIKLYSHEVHELTMKVGSRIAESMGLGCDLFRGWTSQFRINKYLFNEETVGSSGVCIHTDSGFLTLLQQDDCVSGLEVMDKTGAFVPVDPLPGSLLINLGDVAKAWSNGRFCNVKHRVQCKDAVQRFSIALFLLGPKEELVEVPAALIDPDHPQLYLPFTYEEYRKLRLSKFLRVGEALDHYAAQQAPTLA